MKLKIIFLVLLHLALVGSFFAGACRERMAYDHLFTPNAYGDVTLETDPRVRVLTHLREGRTPDALSTRPRSLAYAKAPSDWVRSAGMLANLDGRTRWGWSGSTALYFSCFCA
jgi:hypothetical protein